MENRNIFKKIPNLVVIELFEIIKKKYPFQYYEPATFILYIICKNSTILFLLDKIFEL